MKKLTLLVFSLLSTVAVKAQEVVSSQGDSYSNASAIIDFTVGEVAINTETDGANAITQGFHQTNWNFLGVEDYVPNYKATIFPNPTAETLNIKTKVFDNVTYSMYDAQWRLVKRNKLSANHTVIQVSELASGSYFLILNNDKQNLKAFKLIKAN